MRGFFRLHASGSAWCSFFLIFKFLNIVVGQEPGPFDFGGGGSQVGTALVTTSGIPTPDIPTPPGTENQLQTESPLLEPDNAPPADVFFRRVESGAVVLGDYIYFDGGRVSQNHTYRTTNPVNATLAIDLTKSWTPADVDLIETEYGSDSKQSLRRQVLLVDQAHKSFYAWGGEVYDGHDIRDLPELWRFQPSDDGGGRWRNETPTDEKNYFFTPKRTRSSAYVSTQNMGYIFGGISTSLTTPEQQGALSGYLTLDFSTYEWSHVPSNEDSPVDVMIAGGAVFAPDLGPNGLIFVFGGVTQDGNTVVREDMLDFGTIHFMDPGTGKWYSQPTSGTPPLVRSSFCHAGVAAEDGSRFDIFIYGGLNPLEDVTYSDVHVLTLPGFHWTTVPGATDAGRIRYRHTCALVGRRHLLSWGGFASSSGMDEPDYFPQGIGLFDMTTMEWTDRYNADAEPYAQNDLISTWYDSNWNDTSMESLSAEVRELLLSDAPSPSPSDSPRGSESSTPVGAIAGGVIGGVVIIAAAAGLFWFWRRKRRQVTKQPELDGAGTARPEMEHTESQQAKSGVQYHQGRESGFSELQAGYLPPELVTYADGNQYAPATRYEVDGTGIGRTPNA